mmetsp:Transcript_595/g.1358  ORF Transcript_595/g.1358 Transcript_595/m.1358 type:complete len:133 (-) Transcript_595:690-1088(-)
MILPGFVAGFVDNKHKSVEEAARMELSEEAHLVAGRMLPLTTAPGRGIFRDKYAIDSFHMFLAMDCEEDASPRALDREEYVQYTRGVSLDEVRQLIYQGQMNTPSALLGMLALDKLQEMGFGQARQETSTNK